ncbi:hypothetical protein J3R30DRAFT_1854898 [Lentinula aciculospora]|uniref:Uncharacterized protein n=1 Tax=Lentinula aciculospora TaxID=153920 RepID=A0A9W9AMA1_9AGAR|nr:hypothetical protein J3R30DRAFT_1854898 [Lentinula aciculospora]
MTIPLLGRRQRRHYQAELMYEPYPAYAQHPQHPQQQHLLPRPNSQITEHPPENNHYILTAVPPVINPRHVQLPTRTPYQNGNRITGPSQASSPEYTHTYNNMPNLSPRIITSASGQSFVSSYSLPPPMTTTYNTPGPSSEPMYHPQLSPVQPLPLHPHSHQSSPWYDDLHNSQSSPGSYRSVSPPGYIDQSTNSYQSPSPVILQTPVPLNLSSVRTAPSQPNYTLVDNNNGGGGSGNSPGSPTSPMSPVSPMSPTSPTSPASPLPPLPPIPPLTPLPSRPSIPSPMYPQNLYTVPRNMPSAAAYTSYSTNTYTMTPAFHTPHMDDRANTPASPSTESSASGSARSVRSVGSGGSGGSIYGGGGGGSPSLHNPGVSSSIRAGDLRTTELVRSAELVQLSEPGPAVGSSVGLAIEEGASLTGGVQRDLAPLPPLHSLKRTHPYKRHPEDDKTLRLLDPRPVPSVP